MGRQFLLLMPNYGFKMKKTILIATLGISAITLGACQTTSMSERAKNFQDQTSARFVGKSIDEVILAFGPPKSRAMLTDGREVLQFETTKPGTRAITSGAVTIGTGYGSGFYGPGYYPRGNRYYGSVGASFPLFGSAYPDVYGNNTPPICIRRFVIDAQKQVQSFNYSGDGCY